MKQLARWALAALSVGAAVACGNAPSDGSGTVETAVPETTTSDAEGTSGGGPAGSTSTSESSGSTTVAIDYGDCEPTVHDGSVTVTGDDELESVRGVTEVVGDLQLEGISTLEPLECLRRVHGTFTIADTQLTSLAGLEGFQLSRNVRIDDNAELLTIDGFGVEVIESVLSGFRNSQLTTFEMARLQDAGAVALGRCEGGAFVGNSNLIDIAFPAMVEIYELSLIGNPALSSLDAVVGNSGSISRLLAQGNSSLDAQALHDAWVTAGHDPSTIDTCENLGEVEPCQCAGK